MRKTFLFAVMAFFAIGVMAQDSETYPQELGYEWAYKLNGIKYSTFNTAMIKQIVALEKERQAGKFSIVARRWYSKDFGPQGSGYDTIAEYNFDKHIIVYGKDVRLNQEPYNDVLWTVVIQKTAVSATDTVWNFTFGYDTDKYLRFALEADTSYTAYAGKPYKMQTLENPIYLPVTYSSSEEKVATVNSKTGEITVVGPGESMIKAAFAGDEEISAKSAEWKLVVKQGDHFVLKIISKERVEKPWGTSGTYLGFEMINVTSENCNDIYGDGKLGSPSLSFNIQTRTLKINNYKRTYTQEEDDSMGWTDWLNYESGPLPLNIQIIGNCEILHNSAGFQGGYDMRIFGNGSDKCRLTMDGRFPQFNAQHKITIDGVQVHGHTTTPHPLMVCEILRVEDNSYYEAFAESYEGLEGSAVAQLNEVEFGEHIMMLTKDVHIEEGTFKDGEGNIAMRVEIGPKMEEVIADDVTFEALELTDDPTGTKQDGILYTLTEKDGVDKTEGCLVINSIMTVEQVSDIIGKYRPGSAAFAEIFHGLTVLLPVGKGNIEVDLKTADNFQLAVQIDNQVQCISKPVKGKVKVPFDNKIETFAYIYAVASTTGSPERRNINEETPEGHVKLYGIKLTTEGETPPEQAIDEILDANQSSNCKFIHNGQLYILRNGILYNANGAKVK